MLVENKSFVVAYHDTIGLSYKPFSNFEKELAIEFAKQQSKKNKQVARVIIKTKKGMENCIGYIDYKNGKRVEEW